MFINGFAIPLHPDTFTMAVEWSDKIAVSDWPQDTTLAVEYIPKENIYGRRCWVEDGKGISIARVVSLFSF